MVVPHSECKLIGLVTGADRSILRIPLKHGLRFEERSPEEIIPLVSRLAGMEQWAARRQLFLDQIIRPENPIIVVVGTFPIDDSAGPDDPEGRAQGQAVQSTAVAHNYLLVQFFGLLRLYRPSAVHLKAYYTYLTSWGRLTPSTSFFDGNRLYGPLFSIPDSEVDGLREFLEDSSLPLGRAHLDLAVELGELSLRVIPEGLQLATAMMGFDALVGAEGAQARWRISAGTAALLAESPADYTTIRSEMSRFYGLRSAILHIPAPRKATQVEVVRLRQLLSRSIQAASRIPGDKESLKAELETRSRNYGDVPPPSTRGEDPPAAGD
ncbi:MAG: hypothetical protein ACLPWO_08155 [Thermoplasmata archaeon]